MRSLTYLTVIAVSVVTIGIGVAAAARTAPSQAEAARPSLTVRSSTFGRIVFDSRGFALYAFTRDPRGRTTCYGDCARAWPPYLVKGPLRAGPGTKRSLLGTTVRRDGSRQLTYAGRPLYYYVGDRAPGVVLCQNVEEFGGLWLVVQPGGALVR